jgi:hypothetical protein
MFFWRRIEQNIALTDWLECQNDWMKCTIVILKLNLNIPITNNSHPVIWMTASLIKNLPLIPLLFHLHDNFGER